MDDSQVSTASGASDGFWVYLDRLVAERKVVLDRPKGSTDPGDPGIVYPAAYGHLEGTSSMDGAGIDVWVGSAAAAALGASGPPPTVVGIVCTVDLRKRDSEVKILLGCSRPEVEAIMDLLNGTRSLRAWLVPRV